VQVFDKDAAQKRISFTAPTEDEANYLALEWKMSRDRKKLTGMTVGEAIDLYIDSKDGVLSPTTISNYRICRRNYLQTLMDVPIKNINTSVIQQAINAESKKVSGKTHRRRSPKTLANAHGLLSAAIKMQDPDFVLRTTLPARPKQILEFPPVSDICAAVKGTDVELPAVLAIWLSFSVSEIRGIQVTAIKDGCVTVCESVVQVEGKAVSKKATKAFERTRKHELPPYIMHLIEQTPAWKSGAGYIETRSGKAITCRFQRVMKNAGLPHMTFHQLRHVNASVMHALNVPDLYAMERGGWKTKSTLNRVYQHTLSAERQAQDAKINEYFSSLFF
jgi:integrase